MTIKSQNPTILEHVISIGSIFVECNTKIYTNSDIIVRTQVPKVDFNRLKINVLLLYVQLSIHNIRPNP